MVAKLIHLAAQSWDAVVIGAGPAGAAAAATLVQGGMRTLLVDRGRFPRAKVCGGCLAPAGVHALESIGLASCLAAARPLPINFLRMCARGTSARLPIERYVTVERGRLDEALVGGVVDLGGVFLGATKARVCADDRVVLQCEGEEVTLAPNVIVVADGLSGTSLADRPRFAWDVNHESPLGLGAVVHEVPADTLHDEITMRCGRHGYVGVAPLGDGRWVVAAALAAPLIRREGPAGAIADVLGESGTHRDALAGTHWQGVGHLTRRRRCVAWGRVLLVGDAVGYVEPLTGEGMSWGICCAARVLPFAHQVTDGVDVSRSWARTCRAVLRSRRLVCRAVCGVARHPHILAGCLRLGGTLSLTHWASRRLCWRSA
ncbi:MAG: FAD-dependent monooxygenase [Vicinamibacterales bacterium]|nr:FAD-dependent monooxygenase [Vicinamibacterales bacterium]